jgi:phasin
MKARARIPAPEAVAPEPEIAEAQAVESAPAEIVAASVPEVVEISASQDLPPPLASASPEAEIVETSASESLASLEPEAIETAPAVAAPEAVHAAVEKTVVEDRTKFVQVKTAAEEATAAVEASFGAARDGVIALNVKALEAIKDEADANLDMLASLARAKSISQVIALQTEFARQRFEYSAAHARKLAELLRKVADETAAPIKAHVAKTFKIAV